MDNYRNIYTRQTRSWGDLLPELRAEIAKIFPDPHGDNAHALFVKGYAYGHGWRMAEETR